MARTESGGACVGVGAADRALGLFQRALDSDIADIQGGTTRKASMSVRWAAIDLIQRCYLGLELRERPLLRSRPP